MSSVVETIQDFVDYAKTLKGDEKGEAQVFCDRLFIAFGHKGYKEAGAELEFRISRKNKSNCSTHLSAAYLIEFARLYAFGQKTDRIVS